MPSDRLSVGNRVSWATSQGRTQGRVVDRRTSDFTFAGQRFRATEGRPKLIVESEKTGARAAHSPSALRRLKDA